MAKRDNDYTPPRSTESMLDAIEYAFERLLNFTLATTDGAGDRAMPSGDAMLDAAARVVITGYIQQQQDGRNGGNGQQSQRQSQSQPRGGNRQQQRRRDDDGDDRPRQARNSGGGNRRQRDDDGDDRPRRARNSSGGNRRNGGGRGRRSDDPRDVSAYCGCGHECNRDYPDLCDCDPDECRNIYDGEDKGPCLCIRPSALAGGVVELVDVGKNERGYPTWRWVESVD